MPAVSKKQQNFFRYLLANPDERKKKGISKKDATDFAQDIQEVSPPGWGHTKAEKEKTKPWKPKSKIGGSAAEFNKDLKSGKFKGLPGDKTYKDKKDSMFKIMWAAKKKGYKPHYKPGTDEKYKKYQDEQVGAKSLVMTGQYLKPAIEQEKQKKKKIKEEEKSLTSMQDNNLYGNAYERSGDSWRISGTPSSKKKKKLKEASYKDFMRDAQVARERLKKKHDTRKEKDAAYVDRVKKGVKFYDKKGSGRLVRGKKVYD